MQSIVEWITDGNISLPLYGTEEEEKGKDSLWLAYSQPNWDSDRQDIRGYEMVV